MNIFYLDPNPETSAIWLTDEHIRKMQIESAQMCSTVHWLTGGSAPYRKCHVNHPCTKWVRESIHHYNWLVEHGLKICEEFEYRYNKPHATKQVLLWLKENKPNLPDVPFTEPPKCMGDEYKKEGVIESYQNFYIEEKIKIKKLKWNKKPERIPSWINKSELLEFL